LLKQLLIVDIVYGYGKLFVNINDKNIFLVQCYVNFNYYFK